MNPNLKVPPKSRFFKKVKCDDGVVRIMYFPYGTNYKELYSLQTASVLGVSLLAISYIAAWEFQVAMNKLLSNCVNNTQKDWDNLKKYYEQQKAWLKWGKCK